MSDNPASSENNSSDMTGVVEGAADVPSDDPAVVTHGGLFVRRPVLAIVLSLLIVVTGLAGILGGEIRELPDVDRPVISVRTTYTGASPETIDREVTAVVEGAAARVSGVTSISSSSSFGSSRVIIEFSDDTDLSSAAADIRDALGQVQRNMPDGAEDPQIVKADANAEAVMRLAVTSETMTVQDITVLVEEEVVDRLSAVPGVADVQVYGDREKIFRVDIDQSRLAALGLTIGSLKTALASVSFDVPAGTLTATTQDIVVRATADVTSPDDFEALYINDRVRVGDVARVTLGADPGDSSLRANGQTGIGMGIVRQAKSNTLEISNGVRDAAAELREILPDGVDIRVTSDDATFISGAIEEVVRTLLIATGVVILVIFIFLLDWRATLIPAVTLPVALTGTFAAIYLMGFSINILTLLALVLATGMVVDDAIVVLENIVRKRNEGIGIRAAAVLGTSEVFFAVIATTATLAAVFVPLSFLPGQAGSLFQEFGFVLAFSVLLSSIVALTLCPMLASRFIKPLDPSTEASANSVRNRARKGVGGQLGNALTSSYRRILQAALNAPVIVALLAVLVCGTAFALFPNIQSELTPSEDRSLVLMRISAPQGVSLDFTRAKMQELENRLQFLVDSGEVQNRFTLAGAGGASNSGFMVFTLASWNERERTQAEIAADVNRVAAGVPGIRAFAFQPNSLGIRGAGQGLQFAFVGNSYEALGNSASEMVRILEDDPRFNSVRLSYETTQPQLSVKIDRERANDLGINISGLAEAMQALLDGSEIAKVFIQDRSFPVKLISTTSPLNDPTDLESIYLKTGDGRMVPMSTIATLEEKAVSPSLKREEQLRSVSITTGLENDFALGNAYAEIVRLAEPILPPGARVVPLAEAATLDKSSNEMLITFAIAIIVVLLVLAAQFESFVSALIIMATVPIGLACAVFALLLTGGTLNVYSQIGLVLLVGVMAKNGILIVEFANQLRNKGLGVREAIEQASLIRLRPVMMTMISTILGALPLVFAFGAGAEAREALGWVIVGGLGLATVATLFVTPVAYLALARFSKPTTEEELRLKRELHEATSDHSSI